MISKRRNYRNTKKSLNRLSGGITLQNGIYAYFYNSNDIIYNFDKDTPSFYKINKMLALQSWCYKLHKSNQEDNKLDLVINTDKKIIEILEIIKKYRIHNWKFLYDNSLQLHFSQLQKPIITKKSNSKEYIFEKIENESFGIIIDKASLILFIENVFSIFYDNNIYSIKGNPINTCIIVEINRLQPNKFLFKHSRNINEFKPLKLSKHLNDLSNALIQRKISDITNILGEMFYYGIDVTKDNVEANRWYKIAVSYNNVEAQYNLGFMFEKGLGVTRNYKQAFLYYKLASYQGHAGALFNLGIMFYYGLGVNIDYTQSLRWFLLSAYQGNVEAQNNVGYMYNYGLGVDTNYNEANFWLYKAADQGLPQAMINLGYIREKGIDINQNLDEAVQWYKRSLLKSNRNIQEKK